MPEFTCKAVDEVRLKDSNFQSALLAVGDTQFSSSLQDEILNCWPKEVPTIIMDLKFGFRNISIHTVSMVVIITDEMNIMVSNF
jgi:hypothetical protein